MNVLLVGSIIKFGCYVGQTRGHEWKWQKQLQELKRELGSVVKTTSHDELFDTLAHEDRHAALVADAYGGTAGAVALENLIKTLIGEQIVDELDSVKNL